MCVGMDTPATSNDDPSDPANMIQDESPNQSASDFSAGIRLRAVG
jgi:hypothetical protein